MHKFAKFIVQQAAKVFPVLSFLVVNTFCSQTILAQTQESARDLEPSTLTAEEINGLKSQVEKKKLNLKEEFVVFLRQAAAWLGFDPFRGP